MLENQFVDTVTPSFEEYRQQTSHGIALPSDKNDTYKEWLSLYAPNAFQTAMMNYQNEYNQPLNQMLRWQKAGLNPYAFQMSDSASGSQGAAPHALSSAPERMKARTDSLAKGVNSMFEAFGVAKELYDYMQYGRKEHFYNVGAANFRSELLRAQSEAAYNELAWSRYWNLGVDSQEQDHGLNVSQSPRARYMENSTQRLESQIKQLDYMVDFLYPSQVEANEARAALLEYQKEIASGRNDAVLNINTGNPTRDAILKMLCYLLMDNVPSVGIRLK